MRAYKLNFNCFICFVLKWYNKKGTKTDPVTVESTGDNVITDSVIMKLSFAGIMSLKVIFQIGLYVRSLNV